MTANASFLSTNQTAKVLGCFSDEMASLVLLSFLLIHHSVVINAMQDSALYRNALARFSVGDFEKYPFTYLWVNKLASSKAADQIDCILLCVGEAKCYSFNFAAFPEPKGLFLCEMLATDKYRSKTKFHANATFHHYSPKVSILWNTHLYMFVSQLNVLPVFRLL